MPEDHTATMPDEDGAAALAEDSNVAAHDDDALAELAKLRERAADGELELEDLQRKEALEAAFADRLADGAPQPTAPAPDPPAELERDDTGGSFLEATGYNVIRNDLLNALGGIGQIPLNVIDEALALNDRATARMKLAPVVPEQALETAKRERRYLELARRVRRDLGELEQRLKAADRLAAPATAMPAPPPR